MTMPHTASRIPAVHALAVAIALVAIHTSLQGTTANSDIAVAWTNLEAVYNPSLVLHGDKSLSALKRTTFRKAKGKTFWVNHLYVCLGPHDDLQGLRCQAYNPWQEPYPECEFDERVRGGKVDVTGLGDVKVWRWPGKGVYAIFGRKPQRTLGASPYCTSKVVYDQWVAQILPEATAGQWRLQQPLRLYIASGYNYPDEAPFIMEKNWMPWVYNNSTASAGSSSSSTAFGSGSGSETLFVTHMVNPHRILEVSPSGACTVRYETQGKPELFSRFTGHDVHGGPPVVRVDGKLAHDGKPYYLGIMHHIEKYERPATGHSGGSSSSSGTSQRRSKSQKSKTVKLYRHFAYKFQPEPPFAITDVSDELNLTFYRHPHHPTKAHIAYVAGLFLSEEGTLYVSYGAGDREARILTMSIAELEALFTGRIEFLPNDYKQ
ncbi:hypothetical protein Agub_g8258 [Astrephomene gubernaculifera]|uniref:Uncharacterized protein n=1 Tax=Astrephomene gubernaculifera TaxID=47775 RepID=A0AAD3DU18_9CHLO|nr:hypothetical protein Agub_g8258 [Astrephomene gubernaculifera]